jgi:hypothetical protein
MRLDPSAAADLHSIPFLLDIDAMANLLCTSWVIIKPADTSLGLSLNSYRFAVETYAQMPIHEEDAMLHPSTPDHLSGGGGLGGCIAPFYIP